MNIQNFDKISIDSFLTLSVIGKGSFGKVILARKKNNNKLYAIKILKKENIINQKQFNYVYTEKEVLGLNNPFIINFHYSFQNKTRLYFVLEYCPGGELFNLINKRKKVNEEQARFFSAQIILALEYLHKNNIVYRDLKPENVLINKDGYIKLTDFGLCKTNVNGNNINSFCGTTEYLAPEILMKLKYGKSIDWWALGCIIYEMIVGIPPFYCDTKRELYERIKCLSPKYPKKSSPQLKNLLDGLLNKDPSKRLGSNWGSIEIKDHIWFKTVNWEYLNKKYYKSPFIPNLDSEVDITNFNKYFLKMSIDDISSIGKIEKKYEFHDFSFNNEWEL